MCNTMPLISTARSYNCSAQGTAASHRPRGETFRSLQVVARIRWLRHERAERLYRGDRSGAQWQLCPAQTRRLWAYNCNLYAIIRYNSVYNSVRIIDACITRSKIFPRYEHGTAQDGTAQHGTAQQCAGHPPPLPRYQYYRQLIDTWPNRCHASSFNFLSPPLHVRLDRWATQLRSISELRTCLGSQYHVMYLGVM